MADRSRIWKLIFLAEILIPLTVAGLALGGILTALHLEENDTFCAACHTQPEVKYLQQTESTPAQTLAAFHAHVGATSPSGNVRCIDCHSAAGTFGRALGLSQGARDLAAYLSGHYHAPAVTTNPLPDASCTKCHAEVVPAQIVRHVTSLKNHFHDLLPLWHQLDSNAARCTDCHTAHTDGSSGDSFVNNGAASAVCDSCHRALSGKVE